MGCTRRVRDHIIHCSIHVLTPVIASKSSFPFSFTLPDSLPSSFSLDPTTFASAPKSSTRATISYILVARLILATGLPTSPRLNEIFTRREITVIATNVCSPAADSEHDHDDDDEWNHQQRQNSNMKITTRTHVIDRNHGGSIGLDVQMGSEEGCWVMEGDEVGLRVTINNGCRGVWVGETACLLDDVVVTPLISTCRERLVHLASNS